MNSTVYVDKPQRFPAKERQARVVGARHGHLWCHMWSEDLDALHAMAAKLGMKREWFQDRAGFPHYDLIPTRREKALKLGAVEKSLREWIRERKLLLDIAERELAEPVARDFGMKGRRKPPEVHYTFLDAVGTTGCKASVEQMRRG